MAETVRVDSSLEGVVVADTAISEVNGTQGILRYRGVPLQDVVSRYHWETLLPWLIDVSVQSQSTVKIAGLNRLEISSLNPMAVLIQVILNSEPDGDIDGDVVQWLMKTVLSFAQTLGGGTDPQNGLVAERYLQMLKSAPVTSLEARALDAYWVIVSEHSLNASTFGVRIAASTGATLPMALAAGVGILSGPLHGGAPSGVLDLLQEAAQSADIARLLRDKIDSGQKLMGFGHRVYRTMDPRAQALRGIFIEMASDHEEVRLALEVESAALRLLQERKPDRVLATNVEFYAGALLHALGIPRSWCPPTFACARLAGWTAHYREQRQTGRLIRPLAAYRASFAK